jgi:hypothetical protein
MATPAPLGPPLEEAIYADTKAAQVALQGHAQDNGYGIAVTSPKKLYQRNPFLMQRKDDETGGETYELTAQETPATTQEVQDIGDEEAEDIALSQAVETMQVTTRAGRKVTAISKVAENVEQAKQAKLGGRGGCGGCASRRGRWQQSVNSFRMREQMQDSLLHTVQDSANKVRIVSCDL